MSVNSPMLSRHSAEIASRFGARAENYELHAGLQRAVADRLAPGCSAATSSRAIPTAASC
jgi:hypothetical protein